MQVSHNQRGLPCKKLGGRHRLAPIRTVSCTFWGCPGWPPSTLITRGTPAIRPLTPDPGTQRTYISAHVEDSQRNRVLPCTHRAEIYRIAFAAAIGNAVFRKYRDPGGTINTRVRSLDLAGRIFYFEDHGATTIGPNSRRCSSHHGRSVVDVDWLANSLAGQRLPGRIIGGIGNRHLNYVATVCERRAVDRVEVVAQLLLQ